EEPGRQGLGLPSRSPRRLRSEIARVASRTACTLGAGPERRGLTGAEGDARSRGADQADGRVRHSRRVALLSSAGAAVSATDDLEIGVGLVLIAAGLYDVFQSVVVPRPAVGRLRLSVTLVGRAWRGWRRMALRMRRLR